MRISKSACSLAVLAGVVAVTLGLAKPQTGPVVPLAGAPVIPSTDAIALELKGSSQGSILGNFDFGHLKNVIEILGVEHERSVTPPGGATGTGLHEPIDPALTLTKRADASSVNLYKAMFTGELLTADLSFIEDSSEGTFLSLRLKQATIESISQSHAPGQVGTEVVKLRYRSALVKYSPDGEDFELPGN